MTEAFEQVCPVYMVYGMTWEQFWYGDPRMVTAFEDAYLLNKRAKNEELWLQGLYIHRAIHAVIASAFGGRNEKYVSSPLDFLPKTRAEKQHEEYQKRKKVIQYLNALIPGHSQTSNKGVDEHGKP